MLDACYFLQEGNMLAFPSPNLVILPYTMYVQNFTML